MSGSRIGSLARLRGAGLIAFFVAVLAAAWAAPVASAATTITPSTPLEIQISDMLGCQLYYNETHQFDVGDEIDNYCGTFVAYDSENVWGDPTANENGINSYTPVSQDLSGNGSPSDPYKLTTVVKVVVPQVVFLASAPSALQAQPGEQLLTITETETYFGDTDTTDGQDFYRTDVTVHNDTNSTQSFGLYHVGDCAIPGGGPNADDGYAVLEGGHVFCTPDQSDISEEVSQTADTTVPPQGDDVGILGFVPITSGSHFLEDLTDEGNGDLFNHVNGNQLPDLCSDCGLDPDEDGPVDNGVALNWQLSLPAGGTEKRCFLTVDSFDNTVPDIPGDCNQAASPPATVQQQPSSCALRISRARVFLFSRHPRLRLVARYRTDHAADVNIDFTAVKNGNKDSLGTVQRHFVKHGLFRLRKQLTDEQAERLRNTDKFVVNFEIPGEPGFCARKYRKKLTVPRIIDGQRVVFQSDSKFGPGSPGHPED